MSIKSRVFWGVWGGGGGSADFIFMGARIFLNLVRERPPGCSTCADRPGFLVLGSAPAPASTFVSEPQIAPLG